MAHLLDVWFGDAKAGSLSQDEAGALSYAYDPGVISRGWSRAPFLSPCRCRRLPIRIG